MYFIIFCIYCGVSVSLQFDLSIINKNLLSVSLSTLISLNNPINNFEQAQYDVYSSNYDKLDSGKITEILGIEDMRVKAGKYVKGAVLEIAVGTGLETEYYNWNNINSYTAIDESIGMLSLTNDRLFTILKQYNPSNKPEIKLIVMDARKLSLPSNKYDSVIDTFSLCVISQPIEAVKEMKRVVKDDGLIILLENSRSSTEFIGRIQDITEPIITPFSKGCRWNENINELARSAGLRLVSSYSIQQGTIYLGVYKLNS